MALAVWNRLRDQGRLIVFPVNRYDIAHFNPSGVMSIGNRDLNACHAVAIVSKAAAILAHIAPGPPPLDNGKPNPRFANADEWVCSKMEEVSGCFNKERHRFENQGAGGIMVYGLLNGEPLRDQLTIVAKAIAKMVNALPMGVDYKVINVEKEEAGPDKSIVVIEGVEPGQMPKLWVEHRQVPLIQAATINPSSSSSAPPSR